MNLKKEIDLFGWFAPLVKFIKSLFKKKPVKNEEIRWGDSYRTVNWEMSATDKYITGIQCKDSYFKDSYFITGSCTPPMICGVSGMLYNFTTGKWENKENETAN